MVKVLSRQSVFDLAIQVSGSAESAFELAMLNGLNITDSLTVGSDLITPEIINRIVHNFYTVNQIKPATEYIINEPQPGLEGIEYWAIEIDFVVS